MELVSQNLKVSDDTETKGFDLSAGKTWIYPENYPFRDYQFRIVQTALYENTLVCLPTGLGKTFIAAVIMYNYWRWYPCGKVIFLAPTKPLVAQQIHACHNVMGIPSTETIELTGAVNQKQREVAWLKKRVVFATPQVFHNDLEKNIVPADLVKCVVIDEAHKALGKHSYCECIRILSEKNEFYRILALSATPGNKIDNVHEVVQNLRIAHMELRDETSPDIIPYINERKVDIILVPLSHELARFKERYIFIMDRHVRVLIQCNVLQGQTANISKGRVFHLLREFQKKTNKSGNYGMIIKTLNILMTMYHAYELMIRDGLRAFHKFYQNHSDKFWMSSEIELQTLLEDIELYLGPFPDTTSIHNGSVPDIPDNLVFGHTKFEKLKDLLLCHFKNRKENDSDSRAIVFVEYREIVAEIYILLLQCRPLIRPQMFVGQAGQKQRQQIKALDDFRSNNVNVLISTSIGEEGLDVGEVDLIICFDISQQSPTRLVQRMGRTGRRRDGHIVILVTDGREHETLKSTMARRDSINNKILNTSNISSSLYQNNPRMIPDALTPQCHRMHINILPKTPMTKATDKKEKVDKKKQKQTRKDIKKNVLTESNVVAPKRANQFSMTKFLTCEKSDEQETDTIKTLHSVSSQNANTCNAIKMSDVKILSLDNEALEFLTICTLRRSERDANYKVRHNINESYLPSFPVIKNFFDFRIPDPGILDCLSSLTPVTKSIQISQSNDVENFPNTPCIEHNALPTPTNKITPRTDISESKFEDLLDDTSSDTSVLEIGGQEIDAGTVSGTPWECREPETSRKSLENVNLEPGVFENLLDESSDSLENYPASEHDDEGQTEFEHATRASSSAEMKTPGSAKSYSSHSKTTHVTVDCCMGEDEIDGIQGNKETNTNTATIAEITSSGGKKFENNTGSRATISGTQESRGPCRKSTSVKNERSVSIGDSREIENTHIGGKSGKDSMISITQAIGEIARINSKDMEEEQVSEDDMFGDEFSFDEGNFDGGICETDIGKSESKGNDVERRNESRNSNVSTGEIFDIDDCEWDEDFEVSIASVENNYFANSTRNPEVSKEKRVSNKIKENVDEQSDSNDWISADKSFDQTKENPPTVSLAKKLASAKKASNSHNYKFESLLRDTESSDDDFVVKKDAKISRECERSRFFDVSRNNNLNEIRRSNDLSSLSKKSITNQYNTSKHFHEFAAPGKYLNKEKKTVHSKNVERKETLSLDRNKKNEDRRKFRRRIKSDFICDEAAVSSDENSDETSGSDGDLADFVSYTQNVHDTTDMHAHYLQSVRSPLKRHNAFLFRKPKSPDPEIEIYSQDASQQEESYLDDSFCVAGDDDDHELTAEVSELSILEQAERELAKRKRKRGRNDGADDNVNKKWKRNKRRNVMNDSSSEDETEILRKQIQDESLLARSGR